VLNGSRVVHKGGDRITDSRMPGITRLGCNTEVGESKPGNGNCLEGPVIFQVSGQAPGMQIKRGINKEEEQEKNNEDMGRPHELFNP
jgi:hypothetical protein